MERVPARVKTFTTTLAILTACWFALWSIWGIAAQASYQLEWAPGARHSAGIPSPAFQDVSGLVTTAIPGLPLPAQPAPRVAPLRASGVSPARTLTVTRPSGGSFCQASYFSGARGASGSALTGMFAAHKTAPFHSHWRITSSSGSVVVEVLDRGPFVAGRCWDLAPAAFSQIASLSAGVVTVSYARVD